MTLPLAGSEILNKRRFAEPLSLLFPCYAIISTSWSAAPAASLKSSCVLMIATLLLLVVGRLPVSMARSLSIVILTVFLILAVSVAALSIPTLIDSGSGRIYSSMFDGPGRAGMVAALLLLGSCSAYVYFRTKTVLIWSLIAVSVNAWLLAVSGTRLALLGLFVGLMVLLQFACLRFVLKVSLIVLIGIALVLGPLAVSVSSRSDARFDVSSLNMPHHASPMLVDQASPTPVITRLQGDPWNDFSSGRLDIWRTKWEQVLEAPIFGVGFDASQSAGEGELMAHSQLLTVAEELGLVGLLLFGLWLVVLMCPYWGRARVNAASMVLAGCVIMLLGDSFLFGWRNPVSALTWLSMVLAIAIARSNRSCSRSQSESRLSLDRSLA